MEHQQLCCMHCHCVRSSHITIRRNATVRNDISRIVRSVTANDKSNRTPRYPLLPPMFSDYAILGVSSLTYRYHPGKPSQGIFINRLCFGNRIFPDHRCWNAFRTGCTASFTSAGSPISAVTSHIGPATNPKRLCTMPGVPRNLPPSTPLTDAPVLIGAPLGRTP